MELQKLIDDRALIASSMFNFKEEAKKIAQEIKDLQALLDENTENLMPLIGDEPVVNSNNTKQFVKAIKTGNWKATKSTIELFRKNEELNSFDILAKFVSFSPTNLKKNLPAEIVANIIVTGDFPKTEVIE